MTYVGRDSKLQHRCCCAGCGMRNAILTHWTQVRAVDTAYGDVTFPNSGETGHVLLLRPRASHTIIGVPPVPRINAGNECSKHTLVAALCDHVVVMLAHAISAVRAECPAPGSINKSQRAEIASAFSLRTSAKYYTGSFTATTCHSCSGVRRAQRTRRTVLRSAAATEAEPIAFARTDPAEAEEEDFYSILGVVSIARPLFRCCLPASVLNKLCAHAALQRR